MERRCSRPPTLNCQIWDPDPATFAGDEGQEAQVLVYSILHTPQWSIAAEEPMRPQTPDLSSVPVLSELWESPLRGMRVRKRRYSRIEHCRTRASVSRPSDRWLRGDSPEALRSLRQGASR